MKEKRRQYLSKEQCDGFFVDSGATRTLLGIKTFVEY